MQSTAASTVLMKVSPTPKPVYRVGVWGAGVGTSDEAEKETEYRRNYSRTTIATLLLLLCCTTNAALLLLQYY